MKPNLLIAMLIIGGLHAAAGLRARGIQPAAQVSSPSPSAAKYPPSHRVTLDVSRRPAQGRQLKAVAPRPNAAQPAPPAKKAKK